LEALRRIGLQQGPRGQQLTRPTAHEAHSPHGPDGLLHPNPPARISRFEATADRFRFEEPAKRLT